MGISKRAKARLKIMSVTDKNKVASAAKILYDSELMGIKRMKEIRRHADKRC